MSPNAASPPTTTGRKDDDNDVDSNDPVRMLFLPFHYWSRWNNPLRMMMDYVVVAVSYTIPRHVVGGRHDLESTKGGGGGG